MDQGQQDKAELAEIESMVGGLAAEKQQMEETVHELMLRLQAATKHTQALADERTFLEDAQRRTLAEEEGSDHTQWYSGMDMRGAGGDDMWNFEQLQREKAMLTEEVARLAQIAEAARVEKARLARVVVDKSKKIAFLYEEKDMLLQVCVMRACNRCHCSRAARLVPGISKLKGLCPLTWWSAASSRGTGYVFPGK